MANHFENFEEGLVGSKKNKDWRSLIRSKVIKPSLTEAYAAMSILNPVLIVIQIELEKSLLVEIIEL